jgi:hypothetical protein
VACPAGPIARAARPTLELADLFGKYADRLGPLSNRQRHVVRAITTCRTAALGGHVRQCEQCGHQEISYNSCRDRHCPKCGALAQARWVEARKADLLPVEYFHLVFTIPDVLNSLFLAHPKLAIDLLFAAVSETLQEVALNPKHLGAKIGLIAVLHTWTQVLLYHPHIHCIVPGGGLDPSGTRWIHARPGFFLPVRVLSKVFRGKLLSKLQAALQNPQATSLLEQAAYTDWVVYCKPPFAGPQQVLHYLGRYTHRIALSNERLVSLKNDQVTFRWKDRAHGNEPKLMTLDAVQFLKRFLLHILPRRLVRIRHYGLLANCVRVSLIARCRDVLATAPSQVPEETWRGTSKRPKETWIELLFRLTGKDLSVCPLCRKGRMLITERVEPTFLVQPRGLSP